MNDNKQILNTPNVNLLKSNTINNQSSSITQSEETKLYVKLFKNTEIQIENDTLVTITNDCDMLYFNSIKKQNILESIKPDQITTYDTVEYTYNDSELVSIIPWINKNIKSDKNLAFFSLGSYHKENFLFGSKNHFTYNSFFNNTFNAVINSLENKFDTIVIDYFKVSNDQFHVDFRNLQFNFQVELIDFLNYLSSEVNENITTTTILTLKFFKYTNMNDVSKTEREGSLMSTVSYVSIEPNKNNKLSDGWNKFYSLVCAINNLNADYFYEYQSVDAALIYNVLKNSSAFSYHVFLEDKQNYNTLDTIYYIASRSKIMNFDLFIIELETYCNIDSFLNENFYSKQDFYILEQIVSNSKLIHINISLVNLYKN